MTAKLTDMCQTWTKLSILATSDTHFLHMPDLQNKFTTIYGVAYMGPSVVTDQEAQLMKLQWSSNPP